MTQRLPLVVAIVLSVLVLAWGTHWHLQQAGLSPEFLAFERSKTRPQLYLPSPVEVYVMDRVSDLWPGFFSRERSPRAEEIPLFYDRLKKTDTFRDLSNSTIEQARQWSVTANSLHLDSLKDLLFEGQQPRTFDQALALGPEAACTLPKVERAYRLAQAVPEWRPQARQILKECQPASLQELWWDLEEALIQDKNAEALREAAVAFQIRMKEASGDYSRWFALEAYQLGHGWAVAQDSK